MALGVGLGAGMSRVRDSHQVSVRLVGAAACSVRRPVVINPAACGVRRAAAERAREGSGHLGRVRAGVRVGVTVRVRVRVRVRAKIRAPNLVPHALLTLTPTLTPTLARATSRHTCFCARRETARRPG